MSLVYINHTKKVFLDTILLIDKALFLFALCRFLERCTWRRSPECTFNESFI